MRFMTWNVCGRFGDNWQRRQRAIAATIRTQRPEFVALQETWTVGDRRQADLLGAELGMSSAFALSRMPGDPDPGVQLGLAVLSRYPLRGVERCPLSDETAALRAEIRLGHRSLHFLTTCLDWEEDHERQRLQEVDGLLELVSKLSVSGDRVVVAGDLNAPVDRPEIKRLLGVLHDCGQQLGPTYSSGNPYLGQGEWLEDHRIDYILTVPATSEERPRCRSWLAGLDEDHGKPPSDHYAVVSDIPLAS
jgi:endonuclease/exonuclease/phosphatase family metal-dependent hydrolase